MNEIMQERPYDGSILNFNKMLYRHSVNKRFGADVEKSMAFKTFKNK